MNFASITLHTDSLDIRIKPLQFPEDFRAIIHGQNLARAWELATVLDFVDGVTGGLVLLAHRDILSVVNLASTLAGPSGGGRLATTSHFVLQECVALGLGVGGWGWRDCGSSCSNRGGSDILTTVRGEAFDLSAFSSLFAAVLVSWAGHGSGMKAIVAGQPRHLTCARLADTHD